MQLTALKTIRGSSSKQVMLIYTTYSSSQSYETVHLSNTISFIKSYSNAVNR